MTPSLLNAPVWLTMSALLFSFTLSAAPRATILHVGDDAAPGGNGRGRAPFTSIAEAVAYGETFWSPLIIKVAPGTYAVDDTINLERPTIHVSTTTELYAAVNDPASAGAVVVLAAGVYRLDPTQPNGGRLEFQPDMAVLGKRGNSEAVVIDASPLPSASYQVGSFVTGAIRMGRGENALEWLTVQSAVNGAAANIETDLPSSVASVRIAHIISRWGTRGIDVRNVTPAHADRVLDAVLEDNHLFDNQLNEGQGIRFINARADFASIRATLRRNYSTGNLTGCQATTLNASGSTILIDSTADRFLGNGAGCTFYAGASLGTLANDNTMVVVAHGSAFENNVGPLPPTNPGGGIVAIAGANGTGLPQVNRNSLRISLWGTRLGGNQVADINAFGARSINPVIVPGFNNQVVIELHGVSKDATEMITPSVAVEPGGTNTVVIVR